MGALVHTCMYVRGLEMPFSIIDSDTVRLKDKQAAVLGNDGGALGAIGAEDRKRFNNLHVFRKCCSSPTSSTSSNFNCASSSTSSSPVSGPVCVCVFVPF